MHPGNGSWGLDWAAMCLPPPALSCGPAHAERLCMRGSALPVGAELSGRLHWGWGVGGRRWM